MSGTARAKKRFGASRRIKEWRREWKLDLIERMNPAWDDLFETLF
jgi:putative endonuclease